MVCGIKQPRRGKLQQIVERLHVSPGWLLSGEGNMTGQHNGSGKPARFGPVNGFKHYEVVPSTGEDFQSIDRIARYQRCSIGSSSGL